MQCIVYMRTYSLSSSPSYVKEKILYFLFYVIKDGIDEMFELYCAEVWCNLYTHQ